MYKIKAPSDQYDRKIGGIQFVSGEAQTESEWLASWFSGRPGFTVTGAEPPKKEGKRKHDQGVSGDTGKDAASVRAEGDA